MAFDRLRFFIKGVFRFLPIHIFLRYSNINLWLKYKRYCITLTVGFRFIYKIMWKDCLLKTFFAEFYMVPDRWNYTNMANSWEYICLPSGLSLTTFKVFHTSFCTDFLLQKKREKRSWGDGDVVIVLEVV